MSAPDLRWFVSCDAAWDAATGRAGLAVQVVGVRGNRVTVAPVTFHQHVKSVEGSVQAEELAILFAREAVDGMDGVARLTNDCKPAVTRTLAGDPAPHPVPLVFGRTGWRVHRVAQRAMRFASPPLLFPFAGAPA